MADKFIDEVGLRTIKTWVDGKFALSSDLTNLSGEVDTLEAQVEEIITEGGEPNIIETVKVNNTALVPDAQKAVNIDLSEYAKTGIDVPDMGVYPNDKQISFTQVDGNSAWNFAATYDENTGIVDFDVVDENDQSPGWGTNLATTDYVDANGGKIDVIKVNGTAQTITNKEVDLSVATKVSDLTNDGDGTAGSEFATKDYVDQNGGKIDVIKVNGTAQTITNKEVDLSVATIERDGNTTRIKGQDGVSVNFTGYTSSSEDTNLIQLTLNAKTPLVSFAKQLATAEYITAQGYQTASDVQTAIDSAVASAYKYKGSVATLEDLPTSGNTAGDVWDVQSTGVNYAWTGTAWDALGSYVDTSVLWTSTPGQSNTLEAMTVAEINAILNS